MGLDFSASDYRKQYESIPYKSIENLDLETIRMMDPELIVGWDSTFSNKVLRETDFWNCRGIDTYISCNSAAAFPFKTIENEYADIANMGRIFDKKERANAIIKQMEDEIERATYAAKRIGRSPRGLIIELMGADIRVYGKKTLAGNILERMNGTLLAAEQRQISKEQIIEMDPDVIFVVIIEEDYTHPERKLDMLYNEKALQDVRCIKERHVYPLPLYSIYSSGTRTLEGIQRIGKGLYPDFSKE